VQLYLSLPDGAASAVGLAAMMMDHYSRQVGALPVDGHDAVVSSLSPRSILYVSLVSCP
jgi:hypothetical protein